MWRESQQHGLQLLHLQPVSLQVVECFIAPDLLFLLCSLSPAQWSSDWPSFETLSYLGTDDMFCRGYTSGSVWQLKQHWQITHQWALSTLTWGWIFHRKVAVSDTFKLNTVLSQLKTKRSLHTNVSHKRFTLKLCWIVFFEHSCDADVYKCPRNCFFYCFFSYNPHYSVLSVCLTV